MSGRAIYPPRSEGLKLSVVKDQRQLVLKRLTPGAWLFIAYLKSLVQSRAYFVRLAQSYNNNNNKIML